MDVRDWIPVGDCVPVECTVVTTGSPVTGCFLRHRSGDAQRLEEGRMQGWPKVLFTGAAFYGREDSGGREPA